MTSWPGPGVPLRSLGAAVPIRRSGGPSALGWVFVLVGARQPDQVIVGDDVRAWSAPGAHVAITVDLGTPGWTATWAR